MARPKGYTSHPLHDTWRAMIRRCHDPKCAGYRNYGARGISVCERWRLSFYTFVDEVGLRPAGERRYSLDRINNDGNYEPGNVRWANYREQQLNKRPVNECRFGHPYTEESTYITSTGTVQCRICRRIRLAKIKSAPRVLNERNRMNCAICSTEFAGSEDQIQQRNHGGPVVCSMKCKSGIDRWTNRKGRPERRPILMR